MGSLPSIDSNAAVVNSIIIIFLTFLKKKFYLPPPPIRIDMLTLPARIFIYNFNTLLRCWSLHPTFHLYLHREALGKRKSFSSD